MNFIIFLPETTWRDEIPSEKDIGFMSRNIGQNWPNIAIALGLSLIEIEHIKADNPGNIGWQIHKALYTVKQNYRLTLKQMQERLLHLQKTPTAEGCGVTVDWDKLDNEFGYKEDGKLFSVYLSD